MKYEPRQLVTPERPLKKATDAKVVSRTIVVRDMLLQALAQNRIVPLDLAQPILRQCKHHDVKLIADKPILTPGRNAIGPVRGAAYAEQPAN